eukprot:scaffold1650_cov124-Isochrysis_galbana.AAC.2
MERWRERVPLRLPFCNELVQHARADEGWVEVAVPWWAPLVRRVGRPGRGHKVGCCDLRW